MGASSSLGEARAWGEQHTFTAKNEKNETHGAKNSIKESPKYSMRRGAEILVTHVVDNVEPLTSSTLLKGVVESVDSLDGDAVDVE